MSRVQLVAARMQLVLRLRFTRNALPETAFSLHVLQPSMTIDAQHGLSVLLILPVVTDQTASCAQEFQHRQDALQIQIVRTQTSFIQFAAVDHVFSAPVTTTVWEMQVVAAVQVDFAQAVQIVAPATTIVVLSVFILFARLQLVAGHALVV